MSSKKDGHGMLDMLERMGMIKKTENGSDSLPSVLEAAQEQDDQQEEATVSSSFWDDTPVYPVSELETMPPVPQHDNNFPSSDTDIYKESFDTAYSGDDFTYEPEEPVQETKSPAYKEPEISEIPQQKSSFFAETSKKSEIEQIYRVSDKVMNEKSFWEDNDTVLLNVDKSLDVPALYSTFGLPASGTNTIYVIEEYLKTLPDSLPSELRRSIILKIVAASGFDFDKLLNDGIDRVSKLNEYAETFSRHTEDILAKNNSQIEDLERQIQSVKETINSRKNLHKQQFLIIEGEAQRLKEILDFVTK